MTSSRSRKARARMGGSNRGSLKISKQPWSKLSPINKMRRVHGLAVLRQMRGGMTFSMACIYLGVSPKGVKRQLGSYIYKRKNRWYAKPTDQIERGMIIYSAGKIKTIVIADSKVSSMLSEYFNNMKFVLQLNEKHYLDKYKKTVITDVNGKRYKLEADLEKIKEIELGREDLEMADIYALN